jgi:hypothetical protein
MPLSDEAIQLRAKTFMEELDTILALYGPPEASPALIRDMRDAALLAIAVCQIEHWAQRGRR